MTGFIVSIALTPLYVAEREFWELNGFVFSAAEIALRRDRERRYEAAARYHFRDRSKDPQPNQGPKVDLKAA